ncbi:MAG: hypothetical protein AAFP82_21860 [Bacteroidota bacterium]
MNNKKFTFKEVYTIEDLEWCFKFRFQKYSDYRRQIFLKSNGYEIDIDKFDFYSKHWGVYNSKNEIISYARIVQREKNLSVQSQIETLIKKYNIIKSSLPIDNFPIVDYQSSCSRRGVVSFLEDNVNKETVELSRFVIKDGSPLNISRFTINSGLGIYKYHYQNEMVVLSCRDKHEKFWHHYGFRKIGVDSTYQTEGSITSVNLYSQLTDIHPKLDERLEEYATQYQSKQEISIEL